MAETKSVLDGVSAQVFKQWTVSLVEVIKSAVVAGITSALTLLYTSIEAGEMPAIVELKKAGFAFLLTFIGALIRYWVNPTQTVIKGQVDPSVGVIPPATAVVKDDAPLAFKTPSAPGDTEIQNLQKP